MISKGLRWLRGGRSASPLFPEDLAPWRVVGASVAGTSHQKLRQPCQDAAGWALGPQRSLIVAVADGAGSAPLGREGAQLAVSTAVEFLSSRRSLSSGDAAKNHLLSALERARSALKSDAETRGVEIRELATTLILVQATAHHVAALQVGDGSAVVDDCEDGVLGLTKPQTGEYINETMFITAEDAMDQAEIVFREGRLSGGAVFSDGLQMLGLKMPEGTPHAPFFKPLLQFVGAATDAAAADEELKSFLRSPRVTGQTTDDLTLVLFSLDPSSVDAGQSSGDG
ncbi:MAG: PP2C family serine/threonine-protein phosphatase [Dehalococcoidia bacterium]